MGLYHSPTVGSWFKSGLILGLFWICVSCTSPESTQTLISVNIRADGEDITLQIKPGSTVAQALSATELTLGELDRVEPPVYTVLNDGIEIRVIRVREEFEVEEHVLPFIQQTVRNESLASDKELLIQAGENGLQEIIYRLVYEDDVLVNRSALPSPVIIEQPAPEIRMIGIRSPVVPISIPGKLLYLRDGNVWAIEDTTAERRVLVSTGDLDGRVLSISSDGSWLLFTRLSNEEGEINTLWAKRIAAGEDGEEPEADQVEDEELVDLGISNVIHFADFVPGSNTKIVFSTVEPREAAPGWQANNDLNAITFSNTGWTTDWTVIMESNSGGVYGWWGTDFIWGPEPDLLTYALPGSVRTLNIKDGQTELFFNVLPLQTRGDWAWIPGITWGSDGAILYSAHHVAPEGATLPEESQIFDLIAVPWNGGAAIPLVSQAGMFSYPIASPTQGEQDDGSEYQIAFLQAQFPNQSGTSRYQLAVMDRDGSNRVELFPTEDMTGLEPQRHWGAWSPSPMGVNDAYTIAMIYEGNIWLIDTDSGEAIQVTGDGLTTRVLWQ